MSTETAPGLAETVRLDEAQELHLRLVLGRASERLVVDLRGLILRHPGPLAVLVHLCKANGTETLLAVGDGYRAAGTGTLFGGVERLLGPDSWRLTPAGLRGKWETLP